MEKHAIVSLTRSKSLSCRVCLVVLIERRRKCGCKGMLQGIILRYRGAGAAR